MLSAKQGSHWYHFYNVFGMTRPGIDPSPILTYRTRSGRSTTWAIAAVNLWKQGKHTRYEFIYQTWFNWKVKRQATIRKRHNQIPHPALKTKREITKYINWRQFTKGTRGKPNSSFPNRLSFSYLKFTKYVTYIIAEPKYKYGQQEQVTVRNHNRSTALERSV